MAVTADAFNGLKCKVEEHDRFIDGNGVPGAKARLALVEKGIESIEKKVDKMISIFVGILVTLLGSVLVWLFTKVLPETLTHISMLSK